MADSASATCTTTAGSVATASSAAGVLNPTDGSVSATPVIVQDTCGGDDVSYQVAIPSNVVFGGVEYNAVYATTNSTIVFGTMDNTFHTYPNAPSISVNAYDWVVLDPANPNPSNSYPAGWRASDEHLIITSSQAGFQVDLAVRPYGQNASANPLSTIVVTAAINADNTLSITYLSDVQAGLNTRTGVRLPDGRIVTLEEAGLTRVYVAPVVTAEVIEPVPVVPTPTPQPTPPVVPSPTPTEPTPTPSPTPQPTSEPTPSPTPTPEQPVVPIPQPEPTPQPEPSTPGPIIFDPFIPTPDPEPATTPDQETPSDTDSTDADDAPLDSTDTTDSPVSDSEQSTDTEAPSDSSTDTENQPQEPSLDPIEEPNTNLPSETPSENVVDEATGLIPNSPDSLPIDTPLLPDAEDLVPGVQVDIAGVENGGIEFYGTQSQPQVIGEDGQLTPPPPPPGSGLEIPEGAITITETFIGQPGGVTFNAPDVAVPVIPSFVCKTISDETGNQKHIDLDGNEHPIDLCTFLPEALNAIPGAAEAVQALGDAYAAVANIGNDMSPITRQKAKKILVATLVVSGIASYRRQ